jgi:hypothetical protein
MDVSRNLNMSIESLYFVAKTYQNIEKLGKTEFQRRDLLCDE